MKSLLIYGALVTSALAFACSDVRVVDDDGNDDGAGGAPASGGGGSSAQPVQARLLTTWYSEEGAGFQLWNEPNSTGIDRAPDAIVVMGNAADDFAVAGDTLLVRDNDALRVFDSVWELGSGATPVASIELNWSSGGFDRLRVIPGLDWLCANGMVFEQASQISNASEPITVGWFEPVHDPAADRLFVLDGGAVRVIEGVSAGATFEPSWTLYEEADYPVTHLISDGQSLYGSATNPGSQFGTSAHILVWPLNVAEPSAPGDLGWGPPGSIQALAALPNGGVVAVADQSLWAWDAGSPTFPDAAWETFESQSDGCLTVSQGGRIYVCANYKVLVYGDASLGDPADMGSGENGLLLVER